MFLTIIALLPLLRAYKVEAADNSRKFGFPIGSSPGVRVVMGGGTNYIMIKFKFPSNKMLLKYVVYANVASGTEVHVSTISNGFSFQGNGKTTRRDMFIALFWFVVQVYVKNSRKNH